MSEICKWCHGSFIGTEPNDEAHFHCDDAYARGRADERASIVAWLSEHSYHPEPIYAIECGKHLSK